MKLLLKISLFLLIFTLNKNVLAENVDNNTNNQSGEITSGSETNKEDNKKEDKEEVKKSDDATLKNIYVNNQKIVCDEEKHLCEYIVEDNSVDKVIITYETNHEKASLSKEKLEIYLKEGENKETVKVTAEDGSSLDYTFKITKKLLSTDSTLKKLVINKEEIELKKDVTKYEISVSYATKKLDFEAIPNNLKAKVLDFKDNKLSYDFYDTSKEFKIKVEAEAGELTTYTVTVTKRDEADTTLKKLAISDVSIDFKSSVTDYEVSVLRNIESVEVEAEATDSKATVDIKNPKTLEIGENEIVIKVENDGNSREYKIKITRLDEEDKNLANLKSLTIEGYELDFKENKYEYDLKIGDVNFLSIEANPRIEDAEVEITGNLDLEDGSVIKITVNYDEETSRVYKINIIKEVEEEKEDNTSKIVIIVAIVLVVIAIIIVIIIQIKNKKQNKGKDKKEEDKKQEKREMSSENIISIDDDIEEII